MTQLFSWASSADSFSATVGTAPSAETAGSYGERFKWPATTAAANARVNLSSPTNFCTRFIYTLAAFASSSHTIMAGFATGTVQQFKVDVTPGGLLTMRGTTSTAVATGTQPLVVGTEYHFEVYRSGASLSVKMYQASNNTLIDSIVGTVGSAALTLMLYGNNASLTGTLGAFTFDEVIITDTATEIGPPVSTNPLSATAVASPSTSAPPYTLTLTINATGGTGAYTYAVTNWGDGTTSGSQASNVFTKSIPTGTAAGTKTVSWTVTG